MKPVRLVFYSHDGFGLGHFRRNLAIADGFVSAVEGANVVLLGGTVPPLLDLPKGIDFIKLPSIRKVDTGRWCSRDLDLDATTVGSLRAGIIEQVVLGLQPDILVVDHTPTGVWGELIPTFEAIRRAGLPTRIVLGLRDILDAPDVTRRLWTESDAFRMLADYYDRVFVYGRKEIFDTVSCYQLEQEIAEKTVFCGYVCAQNKPQDDIDVRARFGVDDDTSLLLVTGGGGSDAHPMMNVYLDALRRMPGGHSIYTLIMAGPLMDRTLRGSLRDSAKDLPLTVLPYTTDMPAYLAGADLVVTMGGYNTLVEALSAGKNVLTIPRSGPSAEQRLRAETFASHGMIHWLEPERLSAEALCESLLAALRSPALRASSIGDEGLGNAVARLRDLLPARMPDDVSRLTVSAVAPQNDAPSMRDRSVIGDIVRNTRPLREDLRVVRALPTRNRIQSKREGLGSGSRAGQAPRIALFTHDTFGLGHVRRCLHLVRSLAESSPDSALLLVTGSPALRALGPLPVNADFVKIPTVVKTGEVSASPPHLPLPLEDIKRLRGRLIYEAVTTFEPDVFVVDNFPLGSGKELLPLLEELANRSTVTALGLRDVLDRPDVVRKDWDRQGVYQVLHDCYDRILVYGTPDVMDVEQAYELSPVVAEKVRYCGYVTRIDPVAANDEASVDTTGLTSPWVLATVGGGGDGQPVLAAFIRAMQALPHVSALVVTGPLMADEDRHVLEALCRDRPGIVVRQHVANLPAYMSVADVVVTMGGYNTLAEVAALGCPAVVVPRTWRYGEHANRHESKREFEQLIRAEAFSALGLVQMLHPDELTPEAFIERIGAALVKADQSPGVLLAVDGVAQATREILDLVEDPSSCEYRETV